jgi:hypothetical protein
MKYDFFFYDMCKKKRMKKSKKSFKKMKGEDFFFHLMNMR